VQLRDHTVLPATHIRTIPAFTLQPQYSQILVKYRKFFTPHLCISPPLSRSFAMVLVASEVPSYRANCRQWHKKNNVIIRLAGLIQITSVTDRHTDGQTTGHSIPRLQCTALGGAKVSIQFAITIGLPMELHDCTSMGYMRYSASTRGGRRTCLPVGSKVRGG